MCLSLHQTPCQKTLIRHLLLSLSLQHLQIGLFFMHFCLANVLCLVLYFLHSPKNYNNGHLSRISPHTPTPHSGRLIYLLNLNHISKELVLNPCCICHFASLCPFYENAFIYNRKSRLSGIKPTSN
jgi:hypothetical protein